MAIKALHILLALAVFFSTTGFSVHRHYCQNELKNSALFVEAGGCHKAEHQACASGEHCSSHDKDEKKNCCKDQSDYYKLDQEKQVQPAMELLKNPALLAAVLVVLHVQLPILNSGFLTEKIFRPPIVCNDFQSLLQTYRL